jgi:anti-anti-sigma factor
MPTDFTVEVERDGESLALRVHGELDISSAERLVDAYEKDLEGVTAVTVDLSDLDFIDSSGIRAVLTVKRRCDAAGQRMVLISGREEVDRVIRMVRLDDSIEVVPGPGGVPDPG